MLVNVVVFVVFFAAGFTFAWWWLSRSRGCSCGHGFGSHDLDGPCRSQVELPHYWQDGSLSGGTRLMACQCRVYDGRTP